MRTPLHRIRSNEWSRFWKRFVQRVFIFGIVVLTAYGLQLTAISTAHAVETGLEFGTSTGLSTQDIRVTIAKIIRAFLGLLGIIGLGVVLVGGFLWMTSGGNEEKVEKAKKLLTNGAIGLTIVLLSFSITQFVLSRLTDALNASRVEVATEGGGGGVLPPGALPGGCADPGGVEPFVCSVTPQQATVGSFVSIRGYRFSEFVAGTSEVRIGNVVATIASCEGQPSWTDNTVIAVVPTLATGTQHGVLLTAGSGVGARNTYAITVTDGVPAPGIACIIPKQSPTGQNVAIWGQGFGADRGTSSVAFGGEATADTFASWTDTQVQTPVPAAATSGEVTATVGAVTSNGYPFTVTCGVPEQCASACCVEGQCVEASACAVGGPPTTEQEGPVITGVSPQTLVHPTEGTSYRRPEDVPEGVQAVVAPNGAAGNYLTIRGRGFGALPGRVVFLGGEGAADDLVAAAPAACAAAWSDEQVIVTIPAGAAIGPIRIEVGDPLLADQTDDAKGTTMEHFRPNTTQRPGLCAIDPGTAELGAAVAIAGVQFGAARGADDAVLFGDVSSGTTSVWGAAAITTTVPNIAEGAAEVRVRVDGELSNAVGFSRAPEPRVPRIRDIMPASGGPGQYVTLRGEYFGSTIGKVTFTRGDDEYEVIPRFPEQCRQEWWRASEITVRIPANTGEWGPPTPPGDFNALGSYEVRVHAREGNALRASNAVSFAVTADQPTPGICAITPSSGPARTLVRVLGERFGGAEGIIRFFDGVALGAADKSTFQWLPGEVSGILVPGTAKTGPVRLWQTGQNPDAVQAENKGSNPVTFEIRDCRAGGEAVCATGQICCGNGTCVARAQDCGVGPTAGSYQWTFATGIIPKVPRVVESCTPTDPSVIPSPSPWDQQGLGQQACVNANIAIRFTASMALDEATAASGIQVYRCGGGTNVASSSGGFEGGALPVEWTVVDGDRLTASAETVAASAAHGGTGVLRLTKRVPSVADQPRTTDLPRDAPVDRHYFAITAPPTLIADTNGTTYTARVFVKGANPNQNPNMRAGIVVGRLGGSQPADAGWWQQAANEVTIDGTWQELAASISFDTGPNKAAPGFVRLYVTGPPRDAPANSDDTYAVEFDDLDIVRTGDACATREALDGLMVRVGSEGGRLQLENNILSVDAPAARWSRGTWYEVIAFGTNEQVTVGGTEVEKVALQSASTSALRLDGDKDGQEGGNYRFRFHTRDSAEPCAIQHVALAPHDAMATRRGPATAGELAGRQSAADGGLVHLRADGIGDPAACFTLATSGMSWDWTAEQPIAPPTIPSGGYASVGDGGRWCVTSDECAVVMCANDAACAGVGGACDETRGRCITTFCTANRCAFTPAGSTQNLFTNTATARAHAETPIGTQGQPRPVEVRATVAAATPRTGTSDLTVRFEKPRITAVYPTASCAVACPNGRIAAIANVDLDPATVQAPATNVKLFSCAQENCRRKHPTTGATELTSIAGMTAINCPALPAAADPCATIRVGNDAQIVMTGASRSVNQSYRVVVSSRVTSAWGVPLTELNYADNDAGVLDSYSWTFRTRGEQCAPSRVEMSPNPLTFTVIGERATVAATPFSTADQCSPGGQPLDLESLAWSWQLDTSRGHVARFTAVTATGTFPSAPIGTFTRTARVSGPSCTLACMVPGSRRLPGICGNGTVEQPAEECEPNAGNTLTCDRMSCLWNGARPIADGGTCGNGIVDAGEECDKVGPDGQLAATGALPEWCDPASCLRKGSGFGSACGNGSPTTPVASAGDGEDCDDGNTNSGDGCSSRCLAEGTPQLYNATTAPNGVIARCGDGIVADGQGGRPAGGEECDLGSQTKQQWMDGRCDFDRCVRLGTEPVHRACLGGNSQGAACEQDSDCPGSTCGTVGQCGNGALNPGEQCDDGMVGWCDLKSANAGASCAEDEDCATGTPQCVSRRCNGASANAGDRCAVDADCTAGIPSCTGLQPMDGDGCSSSCLREGASITWRNVVTDVAQPSMCGDGRVHTGEMCDLGSVTGAPDAMQIVQATGSASAVEPGLQAAEIRATVNGVPGIGRVELQCGYERDAQCSNSTVNGVDRQGCCRPRPTIVERVPAANATAVCRNAQITVRFSENMDPGSVGKVTDAASSTTRQRGAVLERCRYQASCGTGGAITPAGARVCKLAADIAEAGTERRCTNDLDCAAIPGTRCHDSTAIWEETTATPIVLERELSFMLPRALDAGTKYRVRVRGTNEDVLGAEVSIRSLEGTRFKTTSTALFTTGNQVCTINRIEVTPPSYLLQRRESRAPLRASAIAQTSSGEQPIVPVTGTYTWGYTWAPSVGNPTEAGEDITTTAPNWTDPKTTTQYPCAATERCAFKPAEPAKNGDAFATATASVALNVFAPTCARDSDCRTGLRCVDHGGTNGTHCVGDSYTGRASLRAFICENPWPEVVDASRWLPYSIAGENIALAYCRDQGALRVCRDPDAEEVVDAKTCAQDSDCASVPDTKCLLALRDDFPAFGDTPVTKAYTPSVAGTDELRKEFFFLPRGVSYCSVSGERCDPTLAGACPAGEFCRAGQDAIGFRIYENERHVGAGRWFQQQGFTEATTPVEVDGYRGIRSGRSVYINAANTGSVYTNLSVLSVNDGAVPETQEILNQVLSGIRFTANLTDQNERRCVLRDQQTVALGRCSAGNQTACVGIGQSCSGEGNGTCTAVMCTADLDCGWANADGQRVGNGTCLAPKDKLQRDIRRLEDLNEIRLAVETYSRGQARCSVTAQACIQNTDCPAGETCFTPSPELAAGSFLPGFTTSRWPSWATELGKALGVELPNDPLNVFGGACVADTPTNAKYDRTTCWNQEEGKYAAASGSYLYEYKRTPTGAWEVRGGFEYIGGTPAAGQPNRVLDPAVPAHTITQYGGVLTQPVTAIGRCGDGALSSGEQCDPPGSPGIPTGQNTTCTTGGLIGSQFWTCEQDCTWSAQPSACGALCGNFVINGTEQCDVGPRGGRVPAGHPTAGTIPGISTSTQYACTTTCMWSGGSCGDGTLQSAYGEQCDGTRNVAKNASGAYVPALSSASTQYECTPVTDANPCKATGGFCGDGTVQAAKGEQCEGDESRSCFDGALTFKVASSSVTLPNAWSSNVTVDAPFTMRAQAENGSIRLALVTSATRTGLSELTRDQIEAYIPRGKTINDYNPQGAQGGIGLYHRIRVEVCDSGGSAPCVGPTEPIWALASTTPQTNSIIIDGVPSGVRMLKLHWDNDWYAGAGGLDLNLRIHEVRLEGDQVRSCGSPGTANACQEGSWQACRPVGALCGNGIVDAVAGEQCDDGGKGRCTNDPLKVCTADTECGAGNACDRSADACTSDCRANTCGDAQQLAPTCTAGDAASIGKPCRSNAECGRNGLCAIEQCDLGTSNWRPAGQCATTGRRCLNADTGAVSTSRCNSNADCNEPATCVDVQCVGDVACPYGRTCNYCMTGSCSISTKQGGFCGDRVKNGPEVCDFADGTNQCAGESAQCQSRTGVASLDWTREVCNAACDAKCPDQYVNQNVMFRGNGAVLYSSLEFTAGATHQVLVQSCRLLGGLTFDVDIAGGVDIWPTPISVVVVTDRSGSMKTVDTSDCDEDGALETTRVDMNGDGTINSDDYGQDARIICAKKALTDSGGLFDKLKEVAEGRAAVGGTAAGQVKVGLVSYGSSASIQTDSDLSDIATGLDVLKGAVNGYAPDLGSTYTGAALARASEILGADTTARTKVIILMSDGDADDAIVALANSSAFKNPSANQFIFTIAFPSAVTGMTSWSSGAGFNFAGGDLDTFYGEIAGKIAGATITLTPSSENTPKVVTLISRSERAKPIIPRVCWNPVTDVESDVVCQSNADCNAPNECVAQGFAQSCSPNGAPTIYDVMVNFRAVSSAPDETKKITLSSPVAQVCSGPPWPGVTLRFIPSGGSGTNVIVPVR